ncbi:MAG: DUF4140 domain-containing protein [Proteobacteria bacterium]|nr:DUF4140 domain-containing protein [Pseudomonadota bacterium]
MRIKAHLINRISSHILNCIFLIACSASAALAENRITFYRDGALLQQEAGAAKGVIVTTISAGLLEHSLTIIPASGTTILSVETRTGEPLSRPDKELETLAEQRRRLEDRLQALETREAIFTAAAKTQSGKAPRKTKANPDPILAIRQGTDFAIAQLETVYTARRKTTQEIRKIDERLATTARKSSRSPETSVRIAVTPPRGRVTLRYATAEHGWVPQYNLYLAGSGPAQLQLSARVTGSMRGYQVRVSPGSLAESAGAETFSAQSGSALLASYRVPITDQRYTEGIFNRFSGRITNSTPHYLPPGDSEMFRNRAYLGKFRFEGLSSGRNRVISLGE